MSPNSKTPTHGSTFLSILKSSKAFIITAKNSISHLLYTCNNHKLIIQNSLPASNEYSKLKISNQWQNVQAIIQNIKAQTIITKYLDVKIIMKC